VTKRVKKLGKIDDVIYGWTFSRREGQHKKIVEKRDSILAFRNGAKKFLMLNFSYPYDFSETFYSFCFLSPHFQLLWPYRKTWTF